MTITKVNNPNYYSILKAMKSGRITGNVWLDWTDEGTAGHDINAIRKMFMSGLHKKINYLSNTKVTRKMKETFVTDLLRDSWMVQDKIRNRIIIHQFNTDIFRKRLPHLITPYSED